MGKAGQYFHAPGEAESGLFWRPVLVACFGGLFGGLFWRPVLAACLGGLFWALLRYQRHPQRVLKYGAETGKVSSRHQW